MSLPPQHGLKVLELARILAGPCCRSDLGRYRGLQIAPEGVPGPRLPIRFSRSELQLNKAAPKAPGHAG